MHEFDAGNQVPPAQSRRPPRLRSSEPANPHAAGPEGVRGRQQERRRRDQELARRVDMARLRYSGEKRWSSPDRSQPSMA